MMSPEDKMRMREQMRQRRRHWRQDKMGMHDRVQEQKEEKNMDMNN
jgi:hypothetical protein